MISALAKFAAVPAPAAPAAAAPVRKPIGPCDKCDGLHDTDECPHFKVSRDNHADAWSKYGSKGKESGTGNGNDDGDSAQQVLRSAQVISKPGDGSCLFHSLAHGLGGSVRATHLRAEIADYIAANPDTSVAGNPLKDWVLWDSGTDVATYAQSMRTGSRWGGALELAVCAWVKHVEVHVYERGQGGFVCISVFREDGSSALSVGTTSNSKILRVVYGGRVHYDALEV